MRIKTIFDNKLEVYFHYLILTAFLFFAFYVGDYFLDIGNIAPFWMFVYWFAVITFSDQIIKYVLRTN